MDSRGVQRGSCSQCDCDQYDGGSKGMKCNYCDHRPGQHVNMSTGIASLAPAARSYSTVLPSSPFDSTIDTKFPSNPSQPVPLFDLNTGVDLRDEYCPQPTDHFALNQSTSSMSMSPLSLFDPQGFGQKLSPVKRPNTASSQVFHSPACTLRCINCI